jgi:hypothetical protein
MDTPKGQVQFAHDQHGVSAARNKAKELGVEKKIERWLNEWQSKGGPAPKGDGATVVKAKAKPSDGRRRVRELGHRKSRKGTVIEEGPQVSVVQWDDSEPKRTFVSNEYLVTQVRKGTKDANDDSDEAADDPRPGPSRKSAVQR